MTRGLLIGMTILGAALIAIVLIVIVGLVIWIATTPSCTDRGGHEVFSHFQPTVVLVGKVPVTSLIPIYDCVGAR